jgi:ketosteroid isomerase-like protein
MKLGHVALLALVTALTLTLGFGLAQGDDAEALETLKSYVQQYADAINQQDAEAFGQLWSEDGKFLPHHTPMVEGREAIVEFEAFSPDNVGTFELSIEATEAISFGDMLYGMGTFRVVGAEGEVFEDGKFMGLYNQVDGGLQLYRLTANSNLPLPEAPAGDSTMTGGGN